MLYLKQFVTKGAFFNRYQSLFELGRMLEGKLAGCKVSVRDWLGAGPIGRWTWQNTAIDVVPGGTEVNMNTSDLDSTKKKHPL